MELLVQRKLRRRQLRERMIIAKKERKDLRKRRKAKWRRGGLQKAPAELNLTAFTLSLWDFMPDQCLPNACGSSMHTVMPPFKLDGEENKESQTPIKLDGEENKENQTPKLT